MNNNHQDKSIDLLIESLMSTHTKEEKKEAVENLKAYLDFVCDFVDARET